MVAVVPHPARPGREAVPAAWVQELRSLLLSTPLEKEGPMAA